MEPSARWSVRLGSFFELAEQHEQPGPCDLLDLGTCWLRSLVAMAARLLPSMLAKAGARNKTRGEDAAQVGQTQGLSKSAIAAKSVKGPHSGQL